MPAPILSSFVRRHHWLPLLLALLSTMAELRAQPLDFSLPGLNQQSVKLADYRGRWVIVNFWASWCSPCLLEMPELQAFYEAHRERATVIGVNFEDRPADEVRVFTDQLAVTFPIALSAAKPVPGFELKGLPTTFLISPAGKLVDTHLGSVSAEMLIERLASQEKAGATAR
ncbi:MAG: TlpA family protein disulfide reductase [Candidatus Competibacteraceae bacterium]|nr:TlpA family protein disulfide reductase [Candidatus Competibacteraceae bacterium]